MAHSRIRRTLATLAVNAVVFLVLAEAVALAIYYIQTGGLFYLHRQPQAAPAAVPERALTASALHPYFGPTHRPGHPFSLPAVLADAGHTPLPVTNNFGFFSAHDYPYVRRGNDFIVGIFGGSVGVWFCQLGAERLVARLREIPALAGRELVPLCFSHEGYKQPQQLLVLTYFLSVGQEFDLVVNIDGFNEVALGSINDTHGADFSMPSTMHLEPLVNLLDQSTLTPAKLAALSAIERHRQRLKTLSERITRNRIASVNVVLEQYYRIESNRLVDEQFRFAALPSNARERSLVYITPKSANRNATELFEVIARSWVSASRSMGDLLAARSIGYIHVLQPNQYYTRRRFGEAERKVALNPQSPFKEGVEHGYPVLTRTAAGSLQQRGITFLDATPIFDSEPSPVYMDDCCHYTVVGNRILADFIAGRIRTSDWIRPPTPNARN